MLCLSQARTWIFSVIYRVFFMFSELRWEVIVRIVNIGEIVDHHFLGFHFIIIDDFLQAWDSCFLFFCPFPLACTFFDLRILVTPWVSSKSACQLTITKCNILGWTKIFNLSWSKHVFTIYKIDIYLLKLTESHGCCIYTCMYLL